MIPRTGRWIIPVLETDEAVLIQDTVDIIDHLERELLPGRSAYPDSPRQLAVAHMLELFGGEGLLRPAMHYRWNFNDSNIPFLFEDFTRALAPTGADEETRRAVFAYASGRMRKVTRGCGVDAETIPEVERSYAQFLALFDTHLESSPYLLGGRPTIADFGFTGPLYAHLARDPYPSLLMKQRAHRVWRWVERMNAPVFDAGEYGDCSQELFADNGIPETLQHLLAYIGEEYAAEAIALVAAIDEWLANHAETQAGDIVGGRPDRRAIAITTFEWRGHQISIRVIPYRLYLLQRLQGAFAGAAPGAQADIRALFAAAGLEPLLDIRPRRRLARRENLDVWGEAQEPVLAAG